MTNTVTEMGLYAQLQTQATVNPDKTALVIDDQRVSFLELNTMAGQIAAGLYQMGVRKGDRIALLMPSSIEWMTVFWGIQMLGAICVPMAPGEGREEITNIFELAEVKVCFAVRRFQVNEFENLFRDLTGQLPSLQRVIITGPRICDPFIQDFRAFRENAGNWHPAMAPELQPSDTYALMATSGTTGVPRLIPKQHGSNLAYLKAYLAQYPISPNDVFMSAMPPFHMLSLSYLLICMMKGATIIYQSFFDPEAMLHVIESERASIVLLSATNAKMMMSDPAFSTADLSSIETFMFSGEFLPDEVADHFYKSRPHRVMNIVGSTEASAYLIWDSQRDNGMSVSALTPLTCVETSLMNVDGNPCKVGERAEIFVSHGDILSEYYRNPEATRLSIVASNTGRNWFKTGDLAIPRPDGRYQFAGRIKRIIKRGATLIYPEEIECFLMTHPDISAAAIIKESDEMAGETMKAFVEVKRGAKLTPIDVVQFCQGRLASIKIPQHIIVVDELPRETGKIQLKKLKEA